MSSPSGRQWSVKDFIQQDKCLLLSFYHDAVGVDKQVRGVFGEAKAAARRKGAFVMMVEQDLTFARFLAGLYGSKVFSGLDLMLTVTFV